MFSRFLRLRGDVTSVFRFYIAIYLLFSLLMVAVAFFAPPSSHRVEPTNLISIGVSVLLLGYLSWQRIEKKMGRAFLPVALVITVIMVMVGRFTLFPAGLTPEETMIREFAWQWQLTIVMLIPMILVSWQYRFRVTVIFILGMTVLSVFGVGASRLPVSWGVALFRCAIYLLVGYIIRWLQSELLRQNQDLQQANMLLARQAETREQLAISRERNRMARELHDTLAHSLTAVAVQLEAVSALWDSNTPAAQKMLDQSLTITRDGLHEARQAILSLRSDPLEDLGLTLALRSLAVSLADRCGSALELELPEQLEDLPLPVERSVYRIAEEALRNISSHASAQHVRMSLRQKGGNLVFDLKDDGIGFNADAGAPSGHFGLRGMQEWADLVGATLAVQSAPGFGTKIHLEWQEGQA